MRMKEVPLTMALGPSLEVQWIGIRLAMQGTWVRSLAQEDSICYRATKPVEDNNRSHVLQLRKP